MGWRPEDVAVLSMRAHRCIRYDQLSSSHRDLMRQAYLKNENRAVRIQFLHEGLAIHSWLLLVLPFPSGGQ
jgi:hypothetical protein